MDMNVEIFMGVASGQQRAALTRLEPERVMISHATQNNHPLPGDHETFIDCGGYSHMMSGHGTYTDSAQEYVDYLKEIDPDWYALRDYPCEPDLLEQLGRSVKDQQQRTTESHIDVYELAKEAGIAKNAVAVIQGWEVEQYISHLDQLRDNGLLTDRVAIGSVCRRNQDKEIARVIQTIRGELPSKYELHAFGVKGSVLRFEEVVNSLDSVDSAAYDYAESRVPSERSNDVEFNWRDSARAYLNWRHELSQKIGSQSLDNGAGTQFTMDTDWGNPNTSSVSQPSDNVRVCLCGTTIPPYGDHDEFEPQCRHCQKTALNYWDRELSVDAR